MRAYGIALSLMLGFASVAYALDEDNNPIDSSGHTGAAVTAAPASTPSLTAPVAAAPTTPVNRTVKSAEPDMKVLAGSGGKITDSVITDAPLMGDFVMGKDTAPLVIIEYASLSCPHCAHFSNAVLPELEKNYIKTGKVRYILRQFPLNEAALKGAMLLDCVGSQDEKKYYTFARVLFDAQSKWAFDTNYLAGLETISAVGGLTKDQFQGCVNNTDRETRILKQKQSAMDDLKIPHTPYIYIGDEVYEGERTPEKMGEFIDAKLAQQKNRSWLPKW